MDQTVITRTLDCQGLYCPEPLFQTREAIDGLQLGETLEVFSDDPAAEEDIKRFVKRTGHELIECASNDGVFRFLIRKTK